AARIEVFPGPPQIGIGDTRDRLADQGRERTLPQPARGLITGVRRVLLRRIACPAAHMVPDTAAQPSSIRPSVMRCHTPTLTRPARLSARPPALLPYPCHSQGQVPGCPGHVAAQR